MLDALKYAIEASQKADWAENGRCSMCSSGDQPDETGMHRHGSRSYLCGNAQTCLICNGCLPPGELCGACLRKNMYDYEC